MTFDGLKAMQEGDAASAYFTWPMFLPISAFPDPIKLLENANGKT